MLHKILCGFNKAHSPFNQKFVIADGITAQAILGMDFLEANKCVHARFMQRKTGSKRCRNGPITAPFVK